jgi:hypothetical protein
MSDEEVDEDYLAIVAAPRDDRKTNRQLTDAEIQQRRDAAKKSADARRLDQAPALNDRWRQASPEERGAMLFFLSQSAKNRQAEIRKQLIDTTDPAQRAALLGEQDSLSEALHNDNWFANESKRISDELKTGRVARQAQRKAEEQNHRELQTQQQYATSIVDRINLGAKIRESDKKLNDLTIQDKAAQNKVNEARAELDRVRQARNAQAASYAAKQKDIAEHKAAEAANKRAFSKAVQERRKGIAAVKHIAQNRKMGLPDGATQADRAAHQQGVAQMRAAKKKQNTIPQPKNGTFVNGKWYDSNDDLVGYTQDPKDKNSPIHAKKPPAKKKKKP